LTTSSHARHTNRLLAALPPADWEAIHPELEWVALKAGTTLHETGDLLRHVYFPASGIVSMVSTMRDGASAEVAAVGRDGVVGVCAFIGGDRTHTAAVVQGDGFAWRMSARSIAAHAERSPAVMRPLLRYTQALFTHMAQTSGCNRHHEIDQQLCRWMLLHLDLCDSDQILATQERIASMLGVRRSGVTGAALKLQDAGLIRYGRGRITVLDRAGLEARSCECYAVIRQGYDRLLDEPAPCRHAPARTAGRIALRCSA
jgi:CRP-like cAMP-binding protein